MILEGLDFDALLQRIGNDPRVVAQARRREKLLDSRIDCGRCQGERFLAYPARCEQYRTYRLARCSCMRDKIDPKAKNYVHIPFYDDLPPGIIEPAWALGEEP